MTAARPAASRRPAAVLLALIALALGLVAQPLTAQAEDTTDRYIVTTSSPFATDAAVARLKRAGIRTSNRYHTVLDGFAATMTTGQVATLRRDSRVRSVTVDHVLRTSSTQTSPTWGLDRVDQRSATLNHSYAYATTGAGVTVFSVDTGIRLDHREFGGRAKSGYDFVDGDSNATDCNGHGTHVAGTVAGSTYGVAKAARLVALRVLDCQGEGYESDFISALQYVVDHRPAGPSVVNISAGGAESTTLDRAVAAVVKAGIPVVVAAGNDDTDACRLSPAGESSAITVAASNESDARAYFSDYGSCVDIFAPGTDITSAAVSSTTATVAWDGTSMATPHVAGAVARYLQVYPDASPAAVSRALIGDATSGAIDDAAGSPNKLLYLQTGTTGTPLGTATTQSDAARTITATWSPPYGFGAPAVTGYRVTIRGAADTNASGVSVDLAATARSFTFVDLKHGAKYTVSVVAIDSAGSGSVASKQVSMLAGPGKGRVATPAAGSKKDNSTSITAQWKAPTSGGTPASYTVAVRRSGSSSVKTYSVKSTTRSRKVTKLKKNASYAVRVRAVNAAGNGTWSGWSAKAKAR